MKKNIILWSNAYNVWSNLEKLRSRPNDIYNMKYLFEKFKGLFKGFFRFKRL